MASISCNSGCQSTSLALAVSLVLLVLFASTSPCAQAFSQARSWSVNVKFVNNLAQTMNVTVRAPHSTMLAPGASAMLEVDNQASLQFGVLSTLFIDNGRFLVAVVGVLSIVVVNGPCVTGQAGLSHSLRRREARQPQEVCRALVMDGLGPESSHPKQHQ